MVLKGFTVKIDKELWKKFSIKCIQVGKTKSEIITELIKKYVEN